MKIELLKDIEQFKQLQKGELILVKWWDFFVRHTPNCKKIMLYAIYENKSSHEEIICQLKGNHYFNYVLYIEGRSAALEVYKVIDNC